MHCLGGFKQHMLRYGVDRDQWAVLLKPALDPKSASFMDRLPQDLQDDFERLSKSLVGFNGINKDYHRRQWEEMAYKEKSSLMEYYQTVVATLMSWTEDLETRKDVLLHVSLEKFIGTLPPQVSRWIRERKPKTGEEAVELGISYYAARPPPENQPRKQNDYRQGNYRPFPNAGRSASKQEEAHGERTTMEEQTKPSDRVQLFDKVRGPRCYRCQKFGHIAPQCPERKSETKQESPVTHKAKMAQGQGASMLATYEGSIDGKPTSKLVRDTGCMLSMVHKRLGW